MVQSAILLENVDVNLYESGCDYDVYTAENILRAASMSQITLWVYTDPHRFHLVELNPDFTEQQLSAYICKHFPVELNHYELCVLIPGISQPIVSTNLRGDCFAGVIMCVPTQRVNVLISSDVTTHFMVTVNLMQSVQELKHQIHQAKGYQIDKQDVLHSGKPMVNSDLLLDYNIKTHNTIKLLLQPALSFTIHVDTFWNIRYSIQINCNMCTEDVLLQVLRKTVNYNQLPAEGGNGLDHLLANKHMWKHRILVRDENKAVMTDKHCIGLYGITKNSTIRIDSTSEIREENSKVINITISDGSTVTANAAKYDTWFIVALKLHGITKVPLNAIRLHGNDRKINISTTIDTFRQTGATGSTNNIDIGNGSKDDLYITMSKEAIAVMTLLDIRIAGGHSVQVQCHEKDSIKDIKLRLQMIGVPEAQYHHIRVKRQRLSGSSKVQDFQMHERVTMELDLYEFPVKVMYSMKTIIITIKSPQPVHDVIRLIEQNTIGSTINNSTGGATHSRAKITFTGRDLYGMAQLQVSETELTPNSVIFVEPVQSAGHVLHLVVNGETIPLPIRPNMHALQKQQLFRIHHHPEMLISALQCFLKWRFHKQPRHHHQRSISGKTQNIGGGGCPRAQHGILTGKKQRPEEHRYSESSRHIESSTRRQLSLHGIPAYQREVTMPQLQQSAPCRPPTRQKSAPIRKVTSWHDSASYTRSADLTTIIEHPDERLMYANKTQKQILNNFDTKSSGRTLSTQAPTGGSMNSFRILKTPKKHKLTVKFSDVNTHSLSDSKFKDYQSHASGIMKYNRPDPLGGMTGRSMFLPRWSMMHQKRQNKQFSKTMTDLRQLHADNYHNPRLLVS